MSKRSLATLKFVFAVALLSVLIVWVSPADLLHALSHLSAFSIFILLALSVLMIFISSVKWKLFLEAEGMPVSTLALMNFYLVGYFVNLLLPSYVGGDAIRSWYIGKKVGQHHALAATILERYTGLVAMLFLGFVFVWMVDLVTTEIKVAVVLAAVCTAVGTALALRPFWLRWMKSFPKLAKLENHASRIQEALSKGLLNKNLLIKSLLISLVYHSLTVVNTLAAAHAVGWANPPVLELYVVLPLILLLGSLPLSPSGLGLQEGAFYYFLHGLGATPAQALGVALVLRGKSYVLALVGGLIWLRLRNSKEPNSLKLGSEEGVSGSR